MALQAGVENATHAAGDGIARPVFDTRFTRHGAAAPAPEITALSRVRFATTRALFESFPELLRKISAPPTDQFPIDFLRNIVSQGKLDEAVTFCAYLLPRREGLWWACRCVRALLGDIPPDQSAGLLAAEAWVREPDDEHRQAALEIGAKGESSNPLTWLALAAGWSGGLLCAHPKAPRPMPSYLTPCAIRVGILISAHSVKKDERQARLQSCIAEGVRLAEAGL